MPGTVTGRAHAWRAERTYAAPLRAPAPHPMAGFAGTMYHKTPKKSMVKTEKNSAPTMAQIRSVERHFGEHNKKC
jgi:hypothetical protein